MVRTLFIHPDLGIGGAERLVVDGAIALQKGGHIVKFLTNHHDPSHCFEETRNGTIEVETVGDWLPRSIFKRFTAACAYFRMLYASFYTAFFLSRQQVYDVIFVDSISVGIPILKWAKGSPKIIFYCHFPDQLLATRTGSIWRKIYRFPINWAEEYTINRADVILVNSKFTRRVFKETFKKISVMPAVLYPSLNTKKFDEDAAAANQKSKKDGIVRFLSINRYERKKNVPLVLKAFKQLEKIVSKSDYERCQLIIAGGYDHRVTENVEHFDELNEMAAKLGITEKCTFLKSPDDKTKTQLIQTCDALVYTPSNEHFGIVPVEAMYMRKPVIACNSGGPTETIINDSTGFLCDPFEEDFGKAMARFVGNDGKTSEIMGEKGRKRVQQNFSFEAFAEKLNFIIQELISSADTTNGKKTE